MTKTTDDCKICSMETSAPEDRVFIDDTWAAEVPPGLEVPGWYFLRTRRHAELVTGIDDTEAATFGPRVKDLTRAVEHATGAAAVYLMSFGENHRHFHALITARGSEVPPEERGGVIVATAEDHIDRDAARTVAAKVRAAYDGSNSA